MIYFKRTSPIGHLYKNLRPVMDSHLYWEPHFEFIKYKDCCDGESSSCR